MSFKPKIDYLDPSCDCEFLDLLNIAGKNGSGATETKHWQDMITKPRQTIVQWHRLKPE